MSYGDYVEQLTYLLFLKMADERSRPPYKQASLIPEPYAWPALLKRDGDELFDHYRHTLEKLGAGTRWPELFQQPAQLAFDFRELGAGFSPRARLPSAMRISSGLCGARRSPRCHTRMLSKAWRISSGVITGTAAYRSRRVS